MSTNNGSPSCSSTSSSSSSKYKQNLITLKFKILITSFVLTGESKLHPSPHRKKISVFHRQSGIYLQNIDHKHTQKLKALNFDFSAFPVCHSFHHVHSTYYQEKITPSIVLISLIGIINRVSTLFYQKIPAFF